MNFNFNLKIPSLGFQNPGFFTKLLEVMRTLDMRIAYSYRTILVLQLKFIPANRYTSENFWKCKAMENLGPIVEQLATLKGAVAVAVVLATMLCGNTLLHFFFPRKSSYKEMYPFEFTFLLLKNKDRILDLCWEYFEKSYQEKGKKTFSFKVIGLPYFVMSNEVENVTYILKSNFENFGKSGGAFKPKFQGLLGDGIFNADGQQWFAHRKTSAHLFKFSKFKNAVLEIFNDDLNQVIPIMRDRTASNGFFDIHDLMHRFTLESISRIAFGVELGCITNEHVNFAADFDYCTACINDSMINPLWRLERYFTPRGWKYFYYLNRLNTFALKLIRERRREFENDASAKEKRSDLLSLYLDRDNFSAGAGDDPDGGSTKSTTSTASAGGSGVSGKYSTYMEPSDKNMRDVILNMIIAGRDTTAQALSWAFYRLCIHPEEQVKIRDEVRKVLGGEDGGGADLQTLQSNDGLGAVSHQALGQMRYTEAFVHEVLRLHPSVPKEAKAVMKDDVLPDGTVVKRGDVFSFQVE